MVPEGEDCTWGARGVVVVLSWCCRGVCVCMWFREDGCGVMGKMQGARGAELRGSVYVQTERLKGTWLSGKVEKGEEKEGRQEEGK